MLLPRGQLVRGEGSLKLLKGFSLLTQKFQQQPWLPCREFQRGCFLPASRSTDGLSGNRHYGRAFTTHHESFKDDGNNDHQGNSPTESPRIPRFHWDKQGTSDERLSSTSGSYLGVLISLGLLYWITIGNHGSDGSKPADKMFKWIRTSWVRLRVNSSSRICHSLQQRTISFLVGLCQNSELGVAAATSMRRALQENISSVIDTLRSDFLNSPEFEKMVASWLTEKAIELCNDEETQNAMTIMIQKSIETPCIGETVQNELEKLLASEATRMALAAALMNAINRPSVHDSASKMGKTVLQTVAKDSGVQNVLSETMWTVFKRTVLPRWGGSSVSVASSSPPTATHHPTVQCLKEL